MAPKIRKSSLVFLSYLFIAAFPQAGFAAPLTFPSSAPCDTTLQACIDGANSGDIISIATNNRIDENLSIAKSLTLTAAAGFTPLIGNSDATNPRLVTASDAGSGGGSVAIFFDQLNFDGTQIDVEFLNDSGHHFEMTQCRLSHNIDNNNETGVDLDFVRVPSTVLLANNFIATPGQPIEHDTNGTSIGDVQITLQGNLITTTNPANSHEGMQIRVGGDENLTLNIFDNVIFGVGGCDCGQPAGIAVDSNNTATAVLNITNNTIDDVATGIGFDIDGVNDTSSMTVDFFNNNVSNVRDQGVFVNGGAGLTINNGFNNFFNNGQPNSGFTEGAGTLFVDPLFIDPATANYRLQPSSPLINVGTNTPTGGLPSVDADNLPRIVGGTVDIGAYEASADLELVKQGSPASLNVGENLTYTLTVTNLGPYDAAGVVLTDPLPAGVTLQSATSSQGSCSGTSTVVCDLGVLTNGAAATVTITVIPQQAGTLTNTASVTSQIPDPASNNDTSSVGTTVNSNIPPITPPVVGDLSGGGCQMGGSTPGMAVPWGFLGLSLLLSTILRKTKKE